MREKTGFGRFFFHWDYVFTRLKDSDITDQPIIGVVVVDDYFVVVIDLFFLVSFSCCSLGY